MVNLGEENMSMPPPMATLESGLDVNASSELFNSVAATNSLSYVTMRKHKKSSRNVFEDEYVVERVPHVS